MNLRRAFQVLSLCLFAPLAWGGDSWEATRIYFPETVEAFFEITDYPALEEEWNQTSLGQLLNDPAMVPFVDAQRSIFNEQWDGIGIRFGLSIEDVQSVASGEVVFAWYDASEPRHEYRVLAAIDTRGREAEREALLNRVRADLQKRKAVKSTATVGDVVIEIHELPREAGEISIRRVVIATHEERLIFADRQDVVSDLLQELQSPEDAPGLLQTVPYTEVEKRLEGPDEPLVRWFVRPLDFAETMQTISAGPGGSTDDIVGLLRDQGFEALQSLGGHLILNKYDCDFFHRAWLYAPATAGGAEKYELAARMLQFPNATIDGPPQWIVPDAGTFARLQWKMEEAFWAAETLVDQAIDKGVFRDTLKGIKEDRQGPQIDIANNVIAHFDERLCVMTDNLVTDEEVAERLVLGVKLTNTEIVKKAMDKWLSNEPNAIRFDYPPHEIWEVRPQGEAVDVDLEGFDDFDFGFDNETDEEAEDMEEPLLDRWAITVHDGWLFFSSHSNLLVEIVERRTKQNKELLSDDPRFAAVLEKLQEHEVNSPAFYRILFPERQFRAKHELLKRRELGESESLFMNIVRRIFTTSDGETKLPEINNEKLPPFAVFEKYLNVGGISFTTEEEGWSSLSFVLDAEHGQKN